MGMSIVHMYDTPSAPPASVTSHVGTDAFVPIDRASPFFMFTYIVNFLLFPEHRILIGINIGL